MNKTLSQLKYATIADLTDVLNKLQSQLKQQGSGKLIFVAYESATLEKDFFTKVLEMENADVAVIATMPRNFINDNHLVDQSVIQHLFISEDVQQFLQNTSSLNFKTCKHTVLFNDQKTQDVIYIITKQSFSEEVNELSQGIENLNEVSDFKKIKEKTETEKEKMEESEAEESEESESEESEEPESEESEEPESEESEEPESEESEEPESEESEESEAEESEESEAEESEESEAEESEESEAEESEESEAEESEESEAEESEEPEAEESEESEAEESEEPEAEESEESEAEESEESEAEESEESEAEESEESETEESCKEHEQAEVGNLNFENVLEYMNHRAKTFQEAHENLLVHAEQSKQMLAEQSKPAHEIKQQLEQHKEALDIYKQHLDNHQTLVDSLTKILEQHKDNPAVDHYHELIAKHQALLDKHQNQVEEQESIVEQLRLF